MEHNSEKYVMTFDKSEVSKCMLCVDPPCTGACPQHAEVANILKSMFFRNYIGAAKNWTVTAPTATRRAKRRACSVRASFRSASGNSCSN